MLETLFKIYYFVLLGTLLVGFFRRGAFHHSIHALLALLLSICITEAMAFYFAKRQEYGVRNMVYHASCIIRLELLCLYFILLLKPRYRRLVIGANIVLWPMLGLLNLAFLQPADTLNSNMTMLECWVMIALSLCSVYYLFRRAGAETIFKNPHFWIATVWMLLGSATFFFWAFLSALYRGNWIHINMLLAAQISIDIISYAGIACIFLIYPKEQVI